jgi:hypothetical protein
VTGPAPLPAADAARRQDLLRRAVERIRTGTVADGTPALDDARRTRAIALAELLGPYRTLQGNEADDAGEMPWWRWQDCPPQVARNALALVDPSLAGTRPNGRPSAAWLVEQAARCGGWLGGHVAPDRLMLRIDALQIWTRDGVVVQGLLAAVAAVPPDRPGGPTPWELALAEIWPTFDATRPDWAGRAVDVLPAARAARDHPAALGLRWD